jgi:integrase/recombinase XerD
VSYAPVVVETAIVPAATSTIVAVEPEPTPDEQLVRLWLDGLSRHTQRAYSRDVGRFFARVGKPLRAVTLADVQGFAKHLSTLQLEPGSRHRVLSAVKSLSAYATRLGYLQYDVARPLRLPAGKDTLTERILEAADVVRLIDATTTPRNRLMLQLLYIAGVRVSELVALTWNDARPHKGAGQITVLGKGKKTRTIRLELPTWTALLAARGSSAAEAPIFKSRKGGHLDESQVLRIVKAAARRAGVTDAVSPHWLRHCHASHALDEGAPIHLVQQTLGHSSVATTSRYLHARPGESSSKFLRQVGS